MSKNLALSFIILFSAFAGADIELKGRPEAVQCARYLNGMSAMVLQGPKFVLHVGSLEELSLLMEASGTPRESILATVLIFNQLLAKAPDNHLLAGVRDRLYDEKGDENRLLLCVTGGECAPKFGGALHVSNQKNFAIVPFELGQKIRIWDDFLKIFRRDAKPGWYLGSGKAVSSAIVIPGGPNISPASWIGNLIHEATHSTDFGLVWDWMKANISIQSKGGEPDNLFKVFVQMRGGTPAIHEGFFRVFIEARAYAAEAGGMLALIPPGAGGDYEKFMRQQAMKDYEDFKLVTDPIVKHFNISSENVFEVGNAFWTQMLRTIEQAGVQP